MLLGVNVKYRHSYTDFTLIFVFKRFFLLLASQGTN